MGGLLRLADRGKQSQIRTVRGKGVSLTSFQRSHPEAPRFHQRGEESSQVLRLRRAEPADFFFFWLADLLLFGGRFPFGAVAERKATTGRRSASQRKNRQVRRNADARPDEILAPLMKARGFGMGSLE